jgi:cysteine desulfurase
MVDRIYLDWNATAPLRPQARAAMAEALAAYGNPSSVHAEGRAARRRVEEARAQVAALVGAEARNVVFTSGGTEANALALSPGLVHGTDTAPRDCLLVSAIEHPSVLAGGRFPWESVERVPVTGDGLIDLDALARCLAQRTEHGCRRPLVSLMLANNETGIVQPVAAAAGIVHAAGGLLHVDAVQAAGRISCDIKELGADLLTLSAHKIGGTRGVGALVKREQALYFAQPLFHGGGQERGARAGTENVEGIVAFGAAAAAVRDALSVERAHMAILRDRLETGLAAHTPAAFVFGAGTARLPNTTLFALAGMKAETAVIALDLAGIAVSSGAACSSGKVEPSHVLAAMAIAPSLALGAIRVSVGPTTAEKDVDCFLDAWIKVSGCLNKDSPGTAVDAAQ